MNKELVKEKGKVVEKKTDTAVVEVFDKSKCAACKHSWFCMGNRQLGMLEVKLNKDVEVGNEIVFEFSEREVFKFSLILYGIPLIFFLLGGLLGYFSKDLLKIDINRDLFSAILSFVFLGISFLTVKRVAKYFINKKEIFPKIVEVLK